MSRTVLRQALLRKNVNRDRLADRVSREPELVGQLLEGLDDDRPPVRYGSSKILRRLSEQRPELLYPYVDDLIARLDCENNFLRADAIFIVSRLAAVDSRRRIDRILDRYLEPIRGPSVMHAVGAVDGAATIAKAKPRLTPKIVDAILGVSRGRYRTPECRHVALGQVIESLDAIFDQVKDRDAALRLVKRQLVSHRPANRKKAERFLRRWSEGRTANSS